MLTVAPHVPARDDGRALLPHARAALEIAQRCQRGAGDLRAQLLDGQLLLGPHGQRLPIAAGDSGAPRRPDGSGSTRSYFAFSLLQARRNVVFVRSGAVV